jgi:hypothetical protein
MNVGSRGLTYSNALLLARPVFRLGDLCGQRNLTSFLCVDGFGLEALQLGFFSACGIEDNFAKRDELVKFLGDGVVGREIIRNVEGKRSDAPNAVEFVRGSWAGQWVSEGVVQQGKA